MKFIVSCSIFALLFSLSFLSTGALARGTGSDTASTFVNSLTHAGWAFEFGINSNFTLTSFQGTVLSVKRQLDSHDAVELGISGYLNNQDNGGSNHYNRGDTLTYGYSQSGTNNYGNFQLNLRYIYYPNPGGRVNLFMGAGPTFGYYRSTNDINITAVIPQPPDPNLRVNYPASPSQTQRSWNAGISAVAGVECFVLKYLSIHARYGFSLVYEKRDYNTNYTYQVFQDGKLTTSRGSQSSNFHNWQVNPAYVLFDLSVYL